MRANRPGRRLRSGLGTVARSCTARPLTSTLGSRAAIVPSKLRPGSASTVTATVSPGDELGQPALGQAEIEVERVDPLQRHQLVAGLDVAADADLLQPDHAVERGGDRRCRPAARLARSTSASAVRSAARASSSAWAAVAPRRDSDFGALDSSPGPAPARPRPWSARPAASRGVELDQRRAGGDGLALLEQHGRRPGRRSRAAPRPHRWRAGCRWRGSGWRRGRPRRPPSRPARRAPAARRPRGRSKPARRTGTSRRPRRRPRGGRRRAA